MLKKEVATQLMEHLVNHDWHGYSQVSRWGDGEGKCIVNIDGMSFELEQGDYIRYAQTIHGQVVSAYILNFGCSITIPNGVGWCERTYE